jgi:arginase
MPHALITAGLLAELGHCPRTDLPEPVYVAERTPPAGVRNLAALAAYTIGLADTVSAALDTGGCPVVIGGDCSVLLGPALALRRRGRYALIHVDAHNDFGHIGNFGAHYPNAAGADLALVTGRGPAELTDLEGRRPYFDDADVFQLGEKAEPADDGYSFADFPQTAIQRYPLARVRREGLRDVLRHLSTGLRERSAAGFWLHVDVDVLDGELMPAVDCPEPAGLGWEEFAELFATFVETPGFVGMNIGIYDPELDANGLLARQLVGKIHPTLLRLARVTVPSRLGSAAVKPL